MASLFPMSPHYLVAFQSSSRDPTASRSSHMVVSVSFPPVSTKHCPAKAAVASGERACWGVQRGCTSTCWLPPLPRGPPGHSVFPLQHPHAHPTHAGGGPALPQQLPWVSQALQHRILWMLTGSGPTMGTWGCPTGMAAKTLGEKGLPRKSPALPISPTAGQTRLPPSAQLHQSITHQNLQQRKNPADYLCGSQCPRGADPGCPSTYWKTYPSAR